MSDGPWHLPRAVDVESLRTLIAVYAARFRTR
jgi:hypothetical protein